MHRKQNVTSLKYFDLNKWLTPAWDSSLPTRGGINSLSMFSGKSILFIRAADSIIAFVSATRPLTSNHRGDSGTTNL